MKHLLTIKLLQVQSGAFDIIVDATGSEVGINYNISFTEEENKPQNLKFTYDNVEYNSIEELENDLSGTIPVEEGNQTRIVNIKWEWPYQTGENPEEIESNDLCKFFKEFKKYIKDCEYIGCTHIKEENCGIKRALEDGKITESRYQNFCKIYDDLKEKEKRKWWRFQVQYFQ